MTTTFSTCVLVAIQQIRDALADEESFHVPSSVIEWFDDQIARLEFNIHEWLAERRQIAVIWCIDDVQAIRPDLDQDQAWDVLQAARRYHDANIGINWDVLGCQADILFGFAPDCNADRGQP